MKPYGQFCPLAQATQLLCERWTLLVVRELIAGSTRFSELQKGLPLMSPTLLSTRLKQLKEAGVLDHVGGKGKQTYKLTAAGLDLVPVVQLLGVWGHRWAPSRLPDGDLDAGLLMWDMRRSIDPGVFPQRRIVVQFEYADAPSGAQRWWLVSEQGQVDLCLDDRGYDVDIVIRSSLKAMTQVWICQRGFNDAVRQGDIKVIGDKKLTGKLQAWLRASGLASLGARGETPELRWQTG
ncbi:MAG: helix-turn-helix transcriptional regulator [Gammaproteobacteria bacterium]|nr:helix-turn-helix transcriptional regulator [Gammaproteobacteria bacterium]